MFLELCSVSGLGPHEKKLTGSPGTSEFPALSIIYSIITSVVVLFRSNMADHKRGRGAQDGVEEHSRGDEEGDSSPTNYICGFCGLLASFRHLEKSYENITHLVAPQGTKTGNKTVTNLHI